MNNCPPEDTIQRHIQGRLDKDTTAALAAHLRCCTSCCALVALLDQEAQASAADTIAPSVTGDASRDRLEGAQFLDEYRIVRVLGSGAMGLVYLAHDTVLDRPVAIKFIAVSTPDAQDRERFLTEARAIARLTHPNVIGVYRVGVYREVPYLVSEYVCGQPLDQVALPLPEAQVLRVALGLSRGLAAAHERGVLHRDIKPANVILTEDGECKLLDFGLAKLTRESADLDGGGQVEGGNGLSVTRTGALVGTPCYMAPEVFTGTAATPRSDIFSLGALLFEVSTGRRLYQVHSVQELAAVHQEDGPSIIELAPTISSALAAVISRCLQRDPNARYASAAEVFEAFDLLRQTSSVQSGLRSTRENHRLRAHTSFPLTRVVLVTFLVGVVSGGTMILARLLQPTKPLLASARLIRLEGGKATLGSSADETEDMLAQCRCQRPDRIGHVPFADKTAAILAQCRSDRQEHCYAQAQRYQVESPSHVVQLTPFEIADREQSIDDFAAWLNDKIKQGLVRALLHRQERDSDIDPYLYVGDYPVLALSKTYHLLGFPLELNQSGERVIVQEGGGRLPVSQVTWYGAQLFCQDQGLRLPTEAEWEFAARGKQRRSFPWGSEHARCDEVQWARTGLRERRGCSQDNWIFSNRFLSLLQFKEIRAYTVTMNKEFKTLPLPCPEPSTVSEPLPCSHLGYHLVDVDQRNRDRTTDGVMHLAGNVAEWVIDAFTPYPPCSEGPCVDLVVVGDVRKPAVPRVYRGGDVGSMLPNSRGASRNSYRADTGLLRVGFRCAAKVDRKNDGLLHLLPLPTQQITNLDR